MTTTNLETILSAYANALTIRYCEVTIAASGTVLLDVEDGDTMETYNIGVAPDSYLSRRGYKTTNISEMKKNILGIIKVNYAD